MDQIVRAKCVTPTVTFTRPNDSNAYTIGDVINTSTSAGTILEFALPHVGELGSAILQSATLISSVAAATKLEGRLWLFDTTLTADNDNAEFTPTDAEMKTLLHVVEFPSASWAAPGATSPNAVCNAQNLWLPINTLKKVNSIFGVLEARNAYAASAQEVFTIRLGIIL